MAMARSAAHNGRILTRIVAALCGSPSATSSSLFSGSAPSSSSHLLFPAILARSFTLLPCRSMMPFTFVSPASSNSSALMIRGSTTRAAAARPDLTVIMRSYSKRPNKWQGGPHAYIQVEPGAPCPPYSPNAGSVKNRKHNKRMAQRHAFAKAQAQQRKQETKAAVIKRDAARRKRWREGVARAQAWAKHLQEQQAKLNAVPA